MTTETETERPTVRARFNALVGRLPTGDWLVIGWALAIKILLVVFGPKAVLVLANKRMPNNFEWLRIWAHWDTLHFLEVAQTGYAKPVLLMAYPLFPMLIRAVHWLAGDFYLSALLVSAIALVFAVVFFRRLVAIDFSDEISEKAVWFFLIFPTAYFLHLAYSESLFLCLVFWAFLAVRKEKWWLGGVIGALAAMTRANGLALVPAFAAEAVHQWWCSGRKWRWQWTWIALVPVGFCIYLAITYQVTGHLFGIIEVRKQIFRTSPAWPWVGITEAYRNIGRKPGDAEMVGAQELFFVVLGLALTVVSWFKLRPSYSTWMTLNWLGFASLTFIQSSPRYTITLFPVFILFAIAGQNRLWNGAITIWSLLFFALFASLAARGWWAF